VDVCLVLTTVCYIVRVVLLYGCGDVFWVIVYVFGCFF